MPFVSYAQNFEDVMLWRALHPVGVGFYIDAGAQHPDVDSVTRAFYDRGWRGINVEPVPDFARRLEAARPRDLTLPIALGAAPGETTLHVVGDTGLSTLDPVLGERHRSGWPVNQIQVQVDTLARVCREHVDGPIHFLKIDVEGSERAVLEGADFSAYRPWIMVLESTAPLSTVQNHGEWEDLVLAAGYRFVWFDGLNRFYVAEEHHDRLAPSFRTPPNVFDGAIRVADTAQACLLVAAEADAADLRRRLAETEARGAAQAKAQAETQERLFAEIGTLRGTVDRLERLLSEEAEHRATARRKSEGARLRRLVRFMR